MCKATGKEDSYEREVCGVYKKLICLKIKNFQQILSVINKGIPSQRRDSFVFKCQNY